MSGAFHTSLSCQGQLVSPSGCCVLKNVLLQRDTIFASVRGLTISLRFSFCVCSQAHYFTLFGALGECLSCSLFLCLFVCLYQALALASRCVFSHFFFLFWVKATYEKNDGFFFLILLFLFHLFLCLYRILWPLWISPFAVCHSRFLSLTRCCSIDSLTNETNKTEH